MNLEPEAARRLAESADHGILATLRPDGRIDVVPAVFAIDGDHLAIPVDRVKPKGATSLQRVRNLDAHPDATFLVERWDAEDWSRLWWVRIRLRRVALGAQPTSRLESALRARYPQYATAPFDGLLVFEIGEVTGWSAE